MISSEIHQRRLDMSTKGIKTTSTAAILGLAVLVAGALAQAARNQVLTKTQTRAQVRGQFVDQDGDGINDRLRDHDSDGIPNCQDPDWAKPSGGTGTKSQFGRNGGESWNRGSFRGQQGGPGTGACDGTGPKGPGKGRRNG
jgi:hypothetical protein